MKTYNFCKKKAVRFLKETVNPHNTIWKKEVENKILPVLFKIALFNKEN